MKKITFLIIVLFPVYAFAQTTVTDSIRHLIKTGKSDSENVRLLVQLGNKMRLIDTAESWRCKYKIDSIASVKKNEFFRGQAFFLAATINLSNQFIQALDNFEKAEKIFLKYPANKRAALALGSVYINMGLLHNNNNDYETAIYYYLRAEEIYQKHDPKNTDLAVLYSNLSITYGTINKYNEALTFSKKGLDLSRKGKDKVSLMNAFYAHGGNLVNAKMGDEGLSLLDSARHIAHELENLYYIYSADLMTAMYYYNNKQYVKAIEYYTNNLNFAIKYNSAPDIGNSYLNISACEAELKNSRQAAAHLDSSAKYYDYSVASISKQMYFENYAEVYKQLGNYDKAFAYKDSVTVIKDSMYQQDNIRQIEFRQARYNYEIKQNEIAQLEADKKIQRLQISQKNILNYFLLAGAITLLVIVLLGYRNYKHKQKFQQQRINELETEKRLAATEAVLKGEEQERSRIAKDLHDGLGGMLSGIKYSFQTMKGNLVMTPDNHQAFERSMDMLDSSIKEMRRVAHNMMPEALVKFGLDTALKGFCNEINQSGVLKVNYQSIGLEMQEIDKTTAITIYRIVQELLNNILKHAGAKTAIVQVSKSDGRLSVTVEDDGHGFDTSILKASRGIGWTNIQNRVEFLKGRLDVSSEINKGTSVLIELSV